MQMKFVMKSVIRTVRARTRVILLFVITSNLIAMKHWTFVDENLTRFQTIVNVLRTNNRSGRICASRPELDIIPRKRAGKLYLSCRIGRVHIGGRFDAISDRAADRTERSLNVCIAGLFRTRAIRWKVCWRYSRLRSKWTQSDRYAGFIHPREGNVWKFDLLARKIGKSRNSQIK